MGLKVGNFFDDLLGELQKDTITTIYGSPGLGKSTICFQYAIECIKKGKKVIFVDTEGGFSVERLKQLDTNVDLNQIIVFSPKSFEEQQKIITNLNKEIKSANTIGLVIVDSIVMLYRLKLGDAPQKINSELGEQLRLLTEISRSFHIPVLVTNQMYKDFETKENKMVGGTLLEYWSKTIIEMDKDLDLKKAILKKHRHKKAGIEVIYEIEEKGLKQINKRSFNLFG